MAIKYNHRALRRLRKARALSVQELADGAGLSRMSVDYIERGMVEPRVTTLAKLASALGVDITEFFQKAA